MPYFEKYGYCIIPKGVLLYRGHQNDHPQDIMFFATKYLFARAFDNRVQIWKVKKPMRILFLVKSLNSSSWGDPSIPDLFYDIFPNEPNKNFNDLDIKHWNIQRRNAFVAELIKHNLNGWLTSIEGKVEIEICLFGKENTNNNIELIKVSNENLVDQYYRDSLKKIEVHPNEQFYTLTNNKIKSISTMYNGKDPHKVYKRMINFWVKEEIAQGIKKSKSLHSFSDLRLKLKI